MGEILHGWVSQSGCLATAGSCCEWLTELPQLCIHEPNRQKTAVHVTYAYVCSFCRQASLRMASASRADPVMAAAAAAALDHEAHSHSHHGHMHAVANHILHHGHHNSKHAPATEHATITISADGTAPRQPPGAEAKDATEKGSPFASSDGQSRTVAAVLGDAGLAVAGMSKPEAKPQATGAAVVPAGWPASGRIEPFYHTALLGHVLVCSLDRRV
jgi:hypothetical protein